MSKSTGANTRQVGGDHYKTAETQHWDVMSDYHVHYLCATATKYIVRARRKSGTQDLEKALHYIEKAIDWLAPSLPPVPVDSPRITPRSSLMPHDVPIMVVAELVESYMLNDNEARALHELLVNCPDTENMMQAHICVRNSIRDLERISKKANPGIEDCSLHALQPDDDK